MGGGSFLWRSAWSISSPATKHGRRLPSPTGHTFWQGATSRPVEGSAPTRRTGLLPSDWSLSTWEITNGQYLPNGGGRYLAWLCRTFGTPGVEAGRPPS